MLSLAKLDVESNIELINEFMLLPEHEKIIIMELIQKYLAIQQLQQA